MNKSAPSPRRHSTSWILGLIGASLACLAGGALLAVSFEGALRVLFALLGFAGYVFYFGRAVRDLLPPVLLDSDPDPEKMRKNEGGFAVAFRQHRVAAVVLIAFILLLPAAIHLP